MDPEVDYPDTSDVSLVGMLVETIYISESFILTYTFIISYERTSLSSNEI
jgi:hypothetical protein